MATPKDPIKVDISMRLDVYQHVAQDIDDIENIVSGEEQEPQSKATPDIFNIFVTEAYAEEELSPDAQVAALARKDRRESLQDLQRQGFVGENRSGLVEIRKKEGAPATISAVVGSENKDRMIIYLWIAKKNGISVPEVEKLYAERLQADAPSGTPIEVKQANGFKWQIKE